MPVEEREGMSTWTGWAAVLLAVKRSLHPRSGCSQTQPALAIPWPRTYIRPAAAKLHIEETRGVLT